MQQYFLETAENLPDDALDRLLKFLNARLEDTDPWKLIDWWFTILLVLDRLQPVKLSSRNKPPQEAPLKNLFKEGGQKLPFYRWDILDVKWLMSSEGRAILINIQRELRDTLDKLLIPAKPAEQFEKVGGKTEIIFGGFVDKRGMFTFGQIETGVDCLVLYRYKFLMFLNGLRLDKLHRCPECSSYFFGRKNARFCSDRCRWRYAQRKARSKDPEKYRDRMRSYMRDVYRVQCGHKPKNPSHGKRKKK